MARSVPDRFYPVFVHARIGDRRGAFSTP
jgi:hypothetical protein